MNNEMPGNVNMSTLSFKLRFKFLILNSEGGSSFFYQKYVTERIYIIHIYTCLYAYVCQR